MPQYRYEGFDVSGGRVAGVVEAEDRQRAAVALRSRGIIIKLLVDSERDLDWRAIVGFKSSSIGLEDLEHLTAELSLLLDSGVRIDRAIGILSRSAAGGETAHLLGSISNQLKQGKQFSEAAAAHPAVFDSLYVNLLALGEASGRLPEVFRGLSTDLRFRRELRQKIVSASIYPVVVAAVCLLSIIFILNFVVPNLQTLFSDADDLPWYTSALLAASSLMINWQWLIFAGFSFLVALVWQKRGSPSVIDFRDRFLLETPGVRDATSMVERIRFCSGIALMLDAGLPVDRALGLAAGNIHHAVLRREMMLAIDQVRRGEQISKALRQTRLFPDYFISLLEVGEESGALARVFGEIASRSRDAFSAWALRLTNLLEPLLVLLMGLIVGTIVVIMMLSITSVADVSI
jgi:type II secretory pathway component PulF